MQDGTSSSTNKHVYRPAFSDNIIAKTLGDVEPQNFVAKNRLVPDIGRLQEFTQRKIDEKWDLQSSSKQYSDHIIYIYPYGEVLLEGEPSTLTNQTIHFMNITNINPKTKNKKTNFSVDFLPTDQTQFYPPLHPHLCGSNQFLRENLGFYTCQYSFDDTRDSQVILYIISKDYK